MARETFDFDSVNLTDGGFYHSNGDANGTMMVGWGRRGRNKWVQLTQPEIVNFIAHGHEMVRTGDTVLTGLLAQVALHLAESAPMTLEQISALASSDPEVGPLFAQILTGPAAGSVESAREILTRELRSRELAAV